MPLLEVVSAPDVLLRWHVEASTERVWSCLTQAPLLSAWLGELVEGEVRTGGEFVVDHGDGYRCRSEVTTCTESAALGFTWRFPDEPASHVALELGGSGASTDLLLRHSGLGELAASYADGWVVHLTYLEAVALGTPLPFAMFWPLHATVARLTEP